MDTKPQPMRSRHRQITAGAGSGKTQRISEIIAEQIAGGTPHEQIVAITYGVQAAQELKERIILAVNARLGQVTGVSQITVGTIHSVCLRLLKTFLPRYSSFRLLSEAQIYLLVQQHFQELGIGRVQLVDGAHTGDNLERTIWNIRVFLDVLAVLREGDVDWGAVPPPLIHAYEEYEALMTKERALDYTGLLHAAVKALENTDDEHCRRLRQHIAANVRELYVDEYQDCNPIQERLIRLFADLGVNVTVVGDAAQAIYGWRGSDYGYVSSFADRYDAQMEGLPNNYRSSPGILDAAHNILGTQAGEAMQPRSHQITEPRDLVAGKFADPGAEAAYIAARIQALIGTPFQDAPEGSFRGLSYSDIAILCRSVRKSAISVVAALEQAGIPYVVSGLGGLFTAPEVQAVVRSFLLLAGCPEVIRQNGKVTGRRAVTAEDVAQSWRRADLGFAEANIQAGMDFIAEQRNRYFEKTDGQDPWGEEMPTLCNLQRLFQDLMGCLQLREEKVPPSSAEAARAVTVMSNLGALSQAIDEYEMLHFRQPPLEKITDFAFWLRDDAPHFYEEIGDAAAATGEAAPRLADPDAVTVCTVHRAKGKEWAAVFVPNMVEGRFPHNTQQSRGRTKWHILPRRAVRDVARYDTTLEEETRLMYVAMTRAKKYLHLTFAPDLASSRTQTASQFLKTFAWRANVAKVKVIDPASLSVSEEKLPPQPRTRSRALVLTFSQISTYLRCSYLFKLRTIFGWAAPPDEAEGFGKGEHDALAEIHTRAIAGHLAVADPYTLAQELTERHLLLPYASGEAYQALAQAAARDLAAYIGEQQYFINGTIHAEMPYEITLEDGLTIIGRNDTISGRPGDETLREIKSRKDVQSEEISRLQLYIEDLGFFAATGRHVKQLEVYNMATGAGTTAGVQFRETFDPTEADTVQARLQKAGQAIRHHDLPRLPVYGQVCLHCDHPGLCRDIPPSHE